MMKLEKIAICEICDNATPQIFIEEAGEYGCQYCFEAYGLELMEFQKGIKKMKMKKVSDYQKDYDLMKSIADSSIANDVELTVEFYNEFLALTKLLKSFGGKL